MSVRLLALAGLLALLSLLWLAPPTRAQEGGRIVGQVRNGTAGGDTPADATVTVHVLRDRAKLGEHVVRTDASGRFAVDGLSTAPDILYLPIVEYGETIYYPDQPVVFGGETSTSTEIMVYETTRAADGLAFERSNLLIMAVSPTSMTVMEMGAVANRSDRTFVGDDGGRTLRFGLPPGATNVEPRTGLPSDTLESLPDGFATTDAIRPGRRELAFSYQLPFDASSLDVVRRQDLPVDQFTLYLPDSGVSVVSTGLRLQGTADLGGQRFQQYVAQNVPAGGELAFRLTGLPAPFSLKPRDLGIVVTGVGTAGLALVLGLSLRRRSRQARAPSGADLAAPEDLERLRLVRSLADLDERFAAGEIAEEEYRHARDRDKRRLTTLLTPSGST